MLNKAGRNANITHFLFILQCGKAGSNATLYLRRGLTTLLSRFSGANLVNYPDLRTCRIKKLRFVKSTCRKRLVVIGEMPDKSENTFFRYFYLMINILTTFANDNLGLGFNSNLTSMNYEIIL